MYTILYSYEGEKGEFKVEAQSKTDAENKFRLNHGSDFKIISIE